jgi:hypothetical protein
MRSLYQAISPGPWTELIIRVAKNARMRKQNSERIDLYNLKPSHYASMSSCQQEHVSATKCSLRTI